VIVLQIVLPILGGYAGVRQGEKLNSERAGNKRNDNVHTASDGRNNKSA